LGHLISAMVLWCYGATIRAIDLMQSIVPA
jgi:hypothetical protein